MSLDEVLYAVYDTLKDDYNTFAQKGNAYIKEALPIIFKGIDEEELFRKLDTLSALTKISTQKGITSTFEIGGRKYTLEAMSQGMEAATYRIKAQDGRSVVFKNYLQENEGDFTFAPKGLYGGLGILREANMAKVVDVPRLYLANPIVSPINGVMHQSFAYQGGWAIVEDVQNRTALKDGLKFLDWIKEKGLEASDINTTGNILNGFSKNNLIQKFELGKGYQFGNGIDGTVIATGVTVSEALKAQETAQNLFENGNINTENMPTETIKNIGETNILDFLSNLVFEI